MPDAIDKEQLVAEILGDPITTTRRYRRGGLSIRIIRELAEDLDHAEVRRFLATYSDTPSRLLADLAETEEDPEILCLVGQHHRTPVQTLAELAAHGNELVRAAVAANRALTPKNAAMLARDGSFAVRRALAENPSVPPRVQLSLVADSMPFIRASLLRQARLDPEAKKLLEEDTDPLVRALAISDPRVDDERLLEWADSDDLLPQVILLLRAKLPPRVLESLTFSTHSSIQCEAISRKTLSADEMLGWAENGEVPVRILIAQSSDAPAEIQEVLARDDDREVRIALAACERLADDVACTLARDSDSDVVQTLTQNPACPEKALGVLCEHSSPLVRKLLADRKDLPPDQVALLLQDGDEELAYHLVQAEADFSELPPDLAAEFANHPLPSLRSIAAAATSSAQIMEELLADPSFLVRRSLAWNQEISDGLLDVLAGDKDKITASRARGVLDQRTFAEDFDSGEDAEEEEEEVETSRIRPLRKILKRVISGN